MFRCDLPDLKFIKSAKIIVTSKKYDYEIQIDTLFVPDDSTKKLLFYLLKNNTKIVSNTKNLKNVRPKWEHNSHLFLIDGKYYMIWKRRFKPYFDFEKYNNMIMLHPNDLNMFIDYKLEFNTKKELSKFKVRF